MRTLPPMPAGDSPAKRALVVAEPWLLRRHLALRERWHRTGRHRFGHRHRPLRDIVAPLRSHLGGAPPALYDPAAWPTAPPQRSDPDAAPIRLAWLRRHGLADDRALEGAIAAAPSARAARRLVERLVPPHPVRLALLVAHAPALDPLTVHEVESLLMDPDYGDGPDETTLSDRTLRERADMVLGVEVITDPLLPAVLAASPYAVQRLDDWRTVERAALLALARHPLLLAVERPSSAVLLGTPDRMRTYRGEALPEITVRILARALGGCLCNSIAHLAPAAPLATVYQRLIDLALHPDPLELWRSVARESPAAAAALLALVDLPPALRRADLIPLLQAPDREVRLAAQRRAADLPA